jgi:hypothetical protein
VEHFENAIYQAEDDCGLCGFTHGPKKEWLRYYISVKSPPKADEYATFSDALRKVLKVSHSEMQARIKADKQARKQRRQKRISARASSAKG